MGKFEPVINGYTIPALVTAVIGLLIAFGVPVTQEQQVAILAFTGAVLAVFGLSAAVVRSQVTPVEKVEENIIPLVSPANQVLAKNRLRSGEKIAA